MRPHKYHNRLARKPYLLAIEQLHARGFHDEEIALTLSHLPASRLPHLVHLGRDCELLDELLLPEPVGMPWTPRQVQYYRTRLLALPGHRPHAPLPPSEEARRDERINYQCGRGWECLLPLVLPRPQVDVLTVLRDRGAQTLRRICDLVGWAYVRCGYPYRVVSELCRRSLVAVAGRLTVYTRPQVLYAVAPTVKFG